MTGIIGLFTGFEQLQVTRIYDETNKIVVKVKNTGTQTASIVDVYINGRPCVELRAYTVKGNIRGELKKGESISFKPDESDTLEISNMR